MNKSLDPNCTEKHHISLVKLIPVIIVCSLFPQILKAQSSPTLSLKGKPTIEAPLPEFKQVFFIQNLSDSVSVSDLTITLFPLWTTGSDSIIPKLNVIPLTGSPVAATGKVGPISIASGSIIQLQISGTLVPQGTYETLLVLTYNNTQDLHDLTINRTNALSARIEMKGKGKVLGSSYGFGANPVTYEFHILNTGETPVSLEAPQIYNLGRSHADQDPVAASQHMTYFDESGDSLTFPITLAEESDQKITLKINDLVNVGNYTGTLSVRAKGSDATVEQELNIQVRHYGVIALIIIAIGVGLSSFVRNYLTVTRVRLMSQQSIARLLQKANEIQQEYSMMNEVPQNILKSIKERLEETMQKIQTQQVPNLDKIVEKQTYKLQVFPGWLAAKTEVAELQNPSITEKLEASFSKVESFLNDDTKEGEELLNEFKPLPKDSGDWIVLIRDAAIGYLEEEIESWEEDAETYRNLIASEAILEEDFKLRTQQKIKIQRYINEGSYTQALNAFEEARKAHLHILAGELKHKLSLSSDTPWMMGPNNHQKWTDLRIKWQEELKQIIHSEEYEISHKLYLNVQENYTRNMTQVLKSWVNTQIEILEKEKAPISSGEVSETSNDPSLTTSLDTYSQQLDEVLTKLDNRELVQAYQQYEKIEASLEVMSQQLLPKTRSGLEVLPAIKKFVKPIFKKLSGNVKVKEMKKKAVEGDFRSIVDLSALTRTLKLNDQLVTLIALLLAAITGLLLLWQKDPTWGTWEDYLLAFLWGFGFDQAGQAAANPNRLGNVRQVFENK